MREYDQLYLARLALDPRDRGVRRELADCQALHRRIMSWFPAVAEADKEAARARSGVLYRADVDDRTGGVTLLVQARARPDWGRLPERGYALAGGGGENPKAIGEVYAGIEDGRVVRFRLRANPARKIETKSGPDGERRNGRRVALDREEERLGWLARRGELAGFVVVSAAARTDAAFGARQAGRLEAAPGQGGGRLTFGAVVFDGVLRVTDGERFRAALTEGVGPGKAYGFGLLSVAPVN